MLMKYSLRSALGSAAMRVASLESSVVIEFSPVTNAATMADLLAGGGVDHQSVERFEFWTKSNSFCGVAAENVVFIGAGAAVGTGAAAAAEDAPEPEALAREAAWRRLAASRDAERLRSLRARAAREDAGTGAAMFLKGAKKEGEGGDGATGLHPPFPLNPTPR